MPFDVFGIKQQYADSKQNPQLFYVPHNDPNYNPANDPKLDFGGSLTGLKRTPSSGPVVDYWEITPDSANDASRINGLTNGGYKSSLIKTDHSVCASQGFMQSPTDWKNIEMTVYIYLVSSQSLDQMTQYCRGGHHSGSHGCEGSSMKGDLWFNGDIQTNKEQWHVSYYKFPIIKNTGVGDIEGRWVGFKVVVYNTNNGQDPKIEFYVDNGDVTNQWKLITSQTDSGGRGSADDCGKDTPKDQKITWGGPIATLRWDNVNRCRFKFWSIREIDPTASFDSGGTPPPTVNTINKNLTIVYDLNSDSGDSCGTGGIAEPLPYVDVYNASADDNNYMNIPKDHVSVGAYARLADSQIIGKILRKVHVTLKKFGAPTGTVFCRIRDSATYTIQQEFTTQLNVATLSTSDTDVDFLKDDASYAIKAGDLVQLEMVGGDSSNYLMVKISAQDKTDGFATVLETREASSSLTSEYKDLDFAGVFYT